MGQTTRNLSLKKKTKTKKKKHVFETIFNKVLTPFLENVSVAETIV